MLKGRATDVEDGDLGGTNVVWISNRDGFLGFGPELFINPAALSDGVHHLSVTVTDSQGLTNTSTVAIRIMNEPAAEPIIVTEPSWRPIGECGGKFTLAVAATGTEPLGYGWFLGSSNPVPNGTNFRLTLTNLSPAHAGEYTVVVTNALGATTSAVSVLTVADTTPPTFVACASNLTIKLGTNCQAALPDLMGAVFAVDSCGATTVTQNPPAGTLVGLGSHTVTFFAMDNALT